MGLAGGAEAHVKWFAAYDCSTTPLSLSEALDGTFWLVCLGMMALLWLVCRMERASYGTVFHKALDLPTRPLMPRLDDGYRALTAVFFVGLFVAGNIILTPELKTDAPYIPWLQAAIAAGMFWRYTMPLSAIGIFYLYYVGVQQYGVFHLLDYPIFLCIALYHVLSGLNRQLFGMRPLDVTRWGAAITLMWASVEKWAYPQWSYPVLQSHPELLLGMTPHFYMVFAGFVEFSLAFALVWTPLTQRLGAIVLLAIFISAIFDFGKIDAIGHLLIIMILLGILVDDFPKHARKPFHALPIYLMALGIFIGSYYAVHALTYGQGMMTALHG